MADAGEAMAMVGKYSGSNPKNPATKKRRSGPIRGRVASVCPARMPGAIFVITL
jgi:hypothetical protein